MKRCRFGAGLLIVLLVIGLLATFWTCRRSEELARDIYLAGEAAARQDWETAEALTEKVRRGWESGWELFATLTDHAPLEQIDGLLAQLTVYRQAEDPLSYGALCARLSREISAIADAQLPNWWNLL